MECPEIVPDGFANSKNRCYLEDHPNIIPLSKWLVTPIYKTGREITLLRDVLIMVALTNWDDPPSTGYFPSHNHGLPPIQVIVHCCNHRLKGRGNRTLSTNT